MTAPIGTPAETLAILATRYRWRRFGAGVAASAGAAWLLGPAAGHLVGASVAWQGTTGLIALGAGIAAMVAVDRIRPVDARALARHLDRRHPPLEESATLLLEPSEAGPLLARLQRHRTAEVFARLDPAPLLPRTAERRGVAVLVGSLALSALFFLLPVPRGVGAAPGSAVVAPTPGRDITPPFVRAATATVDPPAYTGVATHRSEDLDIDAEEGATVTWRVTPNRRIQGMRLEGTDGVRIAFTAGPGGAWTGRLPAADRSFLYRIVLTETDSAVSRTPDHRLTVRADAAPVIAIVVPDARTVVPFGGAMQVPVEVVVRDDYGPDSIGLAATLTTGRGEGVKFRRLTLPFTSRTSQGRGTVLVRRTLDLRALGLGPGDELYFQVEATDHRPGRSNRTSSETIFLTVPDTARVIAAEFSGLALSLPPEYFRSQRQIIIDTERLVAEMSRLPDAVMRDRANGIGIDQGLLRLRYGQFLGDEFEDTPAPVHDEPVAPTDPNAPPPDPLAEFTHDHDTEENATLLGASVKQKLKAAVAEMWAAELRLRTARPAEALPFEYRALALLKEVQQDARTYVKRVGFEPPPLEPDRKRLTGDLSKVVPPTHTGSAAPEPSLPAIRAALDVVRTLEAGTAETGPTIAALQAAGEELARLTVDDPKLLPLLRDVRALLDAVARGAECPACAARAERAFLLVLPAAPESPGARGNPTGGLGRAYRDALRPGGAGR